MKFGLFHLQSPIIIKPGCLFIYSHLQKFSLKITFSYPKFAIALEIDADAEEDPEGRIFIEINI